MKNPDTNSTSADGLVAVDPPALTAIAPQEFGDAIIISVKTAMRYIQAVQVDIEFNEKKSLILVVVVCRIFNTFHLCTDPRTFRGVILW